MKRAHVRRPEHEQEGAHSVVTTEVSIGSRTQRVWYRSDGRLTPSPDAFLAASLLPAMREGLPLVVDGPVSPLLLSHLTQIQEIVHAWDRRLIPIPVEVEPLRAPVAPGPGTGCYFSGGVDSFYSVLKHRGEITDLIFVHGFDIPISDTPHLGLVRASLEAAASRLGMRLLNVETNLRSLSDEYVSWGMYHGAALASVALAAASLFRKVYIPSSYSYAELFLWGSHPLLDPLWSTEATTLVHDGCEAGRLEKIMRISAHDAARQHLRVCWENVEKRYNCGACEKCLRTMIGLRIAGALERCSTFDRPLDPAAVARMRLRTAGASVFLEENLKALDRTGEYPALAQALRQCRDGQDEMRRADERWKADVELARRELAELVPTGETLILADDDQLQDTLTGDYPVLPCTERDGRCWGPPVDDPAAVAELERLRAAGGRFFVVAWPALWWLDYYEGFRRHLRERYPCLLENTRLAVFDLRAPGPSTASCST